LSAFLAGKLSNVFRILTLKHLLAALAVYQVVRMLRTRTGVGIPSAVERIHRPAP